MIALAASASQNAALPAKGTHENSVNRLIVAWQHGDDEAAHLLCVRHVPQIRQAIRRGLPKSLQSRITEDDLLQAVLLALLTRLGQEIAEFPNDASFACWVWRFAINKVAKCVAYEYAQCRSPKREASVGGMSTTEGTHDGERYELVVANASSDSEGTPLDRLILEETLTTIRQQLPTKVHAVFDLLRTGHRYHEIASLLGVSTRTVQRHKERILQIAREVE